MSRSTISTFKLFEMFPDEASARQYHIYAKPISTMKTGSELSNELNQIADDWEQTPIMAELFAERDTLRQENERLREENRELSAIAIDAARQSETIVKADSA